MAQVIRLVKRDQREIQAWIEAMLVKVERFLTRFSLITAAISLLALINNYHPFAEIACTLCVISLLAYADKRRIAKFLVLNSRREDLLVLSVSRQDDSSQSIPSLG